MADLSIAFYDVGTVSVGNGSTAVTGVGTSWLAAGLEAGDTLVINGLEQRILSVNNNTSITLMGPWPGANVASQNYFIARTPDAARVMEWARRMISAIESGGLAAMSGLTGAANKLAYYTGPSTMALTDITAAARAILALTGSAGAKIPVVTAAGVAALRDIVGTVSQASGVPTGAIVQRGSNANGSFVRWADGTQICQHTISGMTATAQTSGVFHSSAETLWTFPAAFASGSPTDNIAVDACARQSVPVWAQGRPMSANDANFRMFALQSISSATFVNVKAMGRWF